MSVTVVVIIGETYLRGAVEAEIAKDLKRYYNLEELPEVAVDGSPFTWRIMTGSFDSISASMKNLDTSQFASGQDRFATPLKIAAMEIVLREIGFSPLRVLGGQKSFSAKSGELTAHVSETSLNEYMKQSGVKVTFDIGPTEVTARATLIGQGQTFAVEGKGRFAYVDKTIVFEPQSVSGEGVSDQVAVNALKVVRPMPSIGGIHPTSVEAADGELILRAEVDAFTFEPIEAEAPPEVSLPSPTISETATPSVSPSPTRSPAPTRTTATPAKKSPTPTRSSTRSPTSTRSN